MKYLYRYQGVKKFLVTILIILILLGALSYRLWMLYLPFSKAEAIETATEYLEKKYNKSFNYESMDVFILEPYGYYMGFIEENSSIDTSVSVTPKFMDWYDVTPEFQVWSDDYVRGFVDNIVTLDLNNYISSTYLSSYIENVHVYSCDSNSELDKLYNLTTDNEKIVENYKQNTLYDVTVQSKLEFDYVKCEEYANKILDVLVCIQNQGYKPEVFYFDYLNGFSLQISSCPDFTLLSSEEGVQIIKEIIRNNIVDDTVDEG